MKKEKYDGVSHLDYVFQGKRGGEPHYNKDVGKVIVCVDNPADKRYSNTISIDAFEGYGDTYGRRSECKVTVCHDNALVFEGTFGELVRRITTDSDVA